MKNLPTVLSIIVAVVVVIVGSSQSHAQDFNLQCGLQAGQAMQNHQCQSQRRFGCAFEKLLVGATTYFGCTGQVRTNRRFQRASYRNQSYQNMAYQTSGCSVGYQQTANCQTSYPVNSCGSQVSSCWSQVSSRRSGCN